MAGSFDSQPRLAGERITLRPAVEADREPLWEVARDPLIWEQHPDKSRADREGFQRFFDEALASNGALVIIDNANGLVIGSSRYYEWDPRQREVAIGYTFLARAYWGGATNAELKRLMIDHAARWARVVWFHVAVMNRRSQRAMEKTGARAQRVQLRPQNGDLMEFIYYRVEISP